MSCDARFEVAIGGAGRRPTDMAGDKFFVRQVGKAVDPNSVGWVMMVGDKVEVLREYGLAIIGFLHGLVHLAIP